MDVVLLSRIQFAFTAMFHFLWPPISIGMGIILVLMEWKYLKTKDELYLKMLKFWVRIFALVFAVGVATGIVMEFEFGTNWAAYSRYVGDVFGSPLAAEGVFAFFMESIFLGVVIFGWNKVKPAVHFFSTIMVALGAHLSALWIIVANSWQQTPAGYHIVKNGDVVRAEITDFWAMVFNPSTVERYTHVVVAAWQCAAFFVLGISAWYLLKRKHEDIAKAAIKTALPVAVVASLLSLGTGHMSGVEVAKYQPAKLAAFEGHFAESAPADLYLFGWVDEKNEKVYGLGLPGMLSFLVSFDSTKPLKGLNAFAPEDRPPVQSVFQSYHLMIGLGMAFIAVSLLGAFLWFKKKLFSEWFLKVLFVFTFLPHVAIQAGWFSAEVGRQPWIVYNLLRTSDAVSKAVGAGSVLFSLVMFTLIYAALFALFVFLFVREIKRGPAEVSASGSTY